MLISQALAHAGSPGSHSGTGPLILLALAVFFILVYVARRRWRRHRSKKEGGAP